MPEVMRKLCGVEPEEEGIIPPFCHKIWQKGGFLYVKLSVGRDDGPGDPVGSVSWKSGPGDQRSPGFGQRGGDPVLNDAGDHVLLVRDP